MIKVMKIILMDIWQKLIFLMELLMMPHILDSHLKMEHGYRKNIQVVIMVQMDSISTS